MPLLRFQLAVGADTAFAKDRIVNTLHFNDIAGSDEEQLCQDIINAYQTHWLSATPREVRCTAYNVGAPPQMPVASVVENEGIVPLTANNREVALCLSYYNVRSNPRRRGRLYLCAALSGQTMNAARPAAGIIGKALDFGDALAAIGGIDVDWGVYSRTDSSFHSTVGTWVDDAWDTMRSRGLSPTTRTERTSGP